MGIKISKRQYHMKYISLTVGILLALQSGAISQDNLSSIKRQMIQESISRYPGNCACPYQYASNGTSCGRRSAYSRPGGYAPLCYEADISDTEAIMWKRNH